MKILNGEFFSCTHEQLTDKIYSARNGQKYNPDIGLCQERYNGAFAC